MHPHIRFVLMSGSDSEELIRRGVRMAEVNFISKPFTVSGLREKLREVLDNPGG